MSKSLKIILFTACALVLLIIISGLINPFLFWYVGSPYKTQKIIYRNKKEKSVTIEFQMQGSGAFGYNRRIVKVEPGLFFDSVDYIDTASIDKTDWIRVDEYVNELGLKGG